MPISGPGLANGFCDRGELAGESSGVGWHGFELVVRVELSGVVVDGVYDHELAAGAASRFDDGVEGRDEQFGAEALAVEVLGECELGEQDRRDVLWGASSGPLRELVALDCVGREREVAHDVIVAIDEDVGAGALSSSGSGVVAQPVVELRVPAGEAGEIVVVGERFEPEGHRAIRRRRRARFAVAVRRGDGWGGSSSAASNASKYFAGTTVEVCAAITSSARATAALTMNDDIDSPEKRAACSMRRRWSTDTRASTRSVFRLISDNCTESVKEHNGDPGKVISRDLPPDGSVAVRLRFRTRSKLRAVDFDDTPEEAAVRKEARAFLEAHARRKTGTDADWSRGNLATDPRRAAEYIQRCKEWQRTLYDNGWAGITWPKEWGGRGGTPAEAIIFAQEAADFDVTNGFIGAAQQLVGPALLRHGTEEQKRRYVPPLLRGDEMWCQLFSEPGAGSDLAALTTRAVADGDEWVVNGQKVWTSAAQHADFGILLARTDPDAPKHRGITFFIVDMRSEGIDIRPLIQATGLSHFNEVFLTDVRIPAANVVGEVGEGWKVARTVLASEAGMIGGAGQTSNFDAVLALARQCGRTTDPVIRQRLADVYTRERILKFMQYRMQTAIMHRRGTPPDPSVLKNFFVETLSRRVELAVEMEGAAGMLAGSDALQDGFWQLQCMAQFSARIGGGTSEVHRNMIGERALGLPPEPRTDKDLPWRELLRS